MITALIIMGSIAALLLCVAISVAIGFYLGIKWTLTGGL